MLRNSAYTACLLRLFFFGGGGDGGGGGGGGGEGVHRSICMFAKE